MKRISHNLITINLINMPTRSGRGFVIPLPGPDTDEEEAKEEEEETTKEDEVSVEERPSLADVIADLRAKTRKTFMTFTRYVVMSVRTSASFVLTISSLRVAQGEKCR